MSTAEAIHICDSQYNPSQVHSTFNIVVSNTQQATTRTVPATAAEILHRYGKCFWLQFLFFLFVDTWAYQTGEL